LTTREAKLGEVDLRIFHVVDREGESLAVHRGGSFRDGEFGDLGEPSG